MTPPSPDESNPYQSPTSPQGDSPRPPYRKRNIWAINRADVVIFLIMVSVAFALLKGMKFWGFGGAG